MILWIIFARIQVDLSKINCTTHYFKKSVLYFSIARFHLDSLRKPHTSTPERHLWIVYFCKRWRNDGAILLHQETIHVWISYLISRALLPIPDSPAIRILYRTCHTYTVSFPPPSTYVPSYARTWPPWRTSLRTPRTAPSHGLSSDVESAVLGRTSYCSAGSWWALWPSVA